MKTEKCQVAAASAIQAVGSSINDCWIGRGGRMALPPRSPDLTQMDFFLWGHFKALIYSSPVDFIEDLIACLVKAAATWHF